MICTTYNNLADEVLQLESQFSRGDIHRASQLVDHFVELFQDLKVDEKSLQHQIRSLNRVLFREHSLRFRASNPARDFTLTGTLLDGRGNCLGLTTAYMVVADRVGVPVRPILYEGHIAVCLEINSQSYPIEVSRGGAMLQGHLADMMYSGKGVGQILTDTQLLAVHMSNQAAFVCVPQDDYESAQSLLECAVDCFPEYIAAWINLAALFVRLNEPDKAVHSLDRVIDLSPSGPYLKHALAMVDYVVQGRMPHGQHIA